MPRFWRALFDGEIVRAETLASMVRDRSPTEPDEGRALRPRLLAPAGSSEVALVGADAVSRSRPQHDPEVGYTHTVIANTSDGAWPVSAELDAIVGVD